MAAASACGSSRPAPRLNASVSAGELVASTILPPSTIDSELRLAAFKGSRESALQFGQEQADPTRYYTGVTSNLAGRLYAHNARRTAIPQRFLTDR